MKTNEYQVFKKYTGIFAISVNGVVGWRVYEEGGITIDRMKKYLDEEILNKIEGNVIIMDNASEGR
jgi:hypothetical protein